MKTLVESYTEIVVSEKESRIQRLKKRLKKSGKSIKDNNKKFWSDAWSKH